MPRKKAPTKEDILTENPDGLMGFMHQDMMQKFNQWTNEICERRFGFSYTKLLEIETAIARMYVASASGSAGAQVELDTLAKEYREVWLPRRYKMMGFKEK